MTREGLRYQAFSRRAFLLAGAQGLAITALGGRLYYLSVVNGEKYRLRADKNRTSLRLLAPVRGEIFDRKRRQIATNRRDYSVYFIPEQAKEIPKTLRKVGGIIKLSDRRIKRIERQIKRQRKFLPVTVAKGLDWKTFSRVNVDMPNLPGVETDVGLSRYYPQGQSVAHIVGYLASPGENDVGRNPLYQLPGAKVGRQGIEKRFEDELRGEAGSRRVEVNAVGREIRELPPRQEALKGQDLHLTLDMELQEFVLSQLGEESAGVVVMDVKNGDVLSLASAPTFDPNEFTSGISNANWNGLLNDPRKPLLNKCMTGQYPPGSTVKMVIALAALEQGIITPETKFFCNGKHRLGNNTFHCWQRRGHGHMDLLNAISNSCDIYFYEIAEKLDIDLIAEMSRRFGLGQTFNLGVDGEKEGLVPDRQWKRAVQNQPWHLGETLNVSIGQGAMLATPLQLAVMTSRIASGNEVTPRLIRHSDELNFDPDFNPLQVNPLNMRVARRGMEMVMEPKGTAHDFRRAKSAIKQAGKTGTAQVRRISKAERETGVLKNEEKPWIARDHALFVGYMPAENPEIAISVLVQHGGGGASKAAPIGRAVLDKAMEILHREDADIEESTT